MRLGIAISMVWSAVFGDRAPGGGDVTEDLLLEDGSFLLLESGDKILLEA